VPVLTFARRPAPASMKILPSSRTIFAAVGTERQSRAPGQRLRRRRAPGDAAHLPARRPVGPAPDRRTGSVPHRFAADLRPRLDWFAPGLDWPPVASRRPRRRSLHGTDGQLLRAGCSPGYRELPKPRVIGHHAHRQSRSPGCFAAPCDAVRHIVANSHEARDHADPAYTATPERSRSSTIRWCFPPTPDAIEAPP
jgi:hypothetical protein